MQAQVPELETKSTLCNSAKGKCFVEIHDHLRPQRTWYLERGRKMVGLKAKDA